MATFVLVHGAWVGSEIWQPIARLLRADGHEVYAPTLTGVGERSHLLRAGIDLDTHIADVANLIKFQGLSDIVLCGHSYGGMVVTGVADAMPDKIASLVYLDAFVPEHGQALSDLAPRGRQPPPADSISVPPLPPSAFGLSPEKAAIYLARATPQPAPTMTQPVRLAGGLARVARRTFIYCNDPQPTTFTQFYERYRHAPGWEMHTLPCTHLAQLDMPEALTRLLLAAAAPLH
jgi:pimeloyl-ACP methyl ester carboxylesterase